VKSGDIEMLQDLVVAAVNEATRKVDEALKSSLAGCSAAWACRAVSRSRTFYAYLN